MNNSAFPRHRRQHRPPGPAGLLCAAASLLLGACAAYDSGYGYSDHGPYGYGPYGSYPPYGAPYGSLYYEEHPYYWPYYAPGYGYYHGYYGGPGYTYYPYLPDHSYHHDHPRPPDRPAPPVSGGDKPTWADHAREIVGPNPSRYPPRDPESHWVPPSRPSNGHDRDAPRGWQAPAARIVKPAAAPNGRPAYQPVPAPRVEPPPPSGGGDRKSPGWRGKAERLRQQ